MRNNWTYMVIVMGETTDIYGNCMGDTNDIYVNCNEKEQRYMVIVMRNY